MLVPSRSELALSMVLAEPKGEVTGCPELVAHQARDIFEFWQRWEARVGERQEPPFWAVVWAAAALAARVILDEPALVAGRRVIDLGCGSGIAAIAARRAGARESVANDIDAAALAVSQLHAEYNGVELTLLHEDLTLSPLRLGRGDVVIVGDLFYEEQPSRPLLELLRAARARGADVLVADAGRAFAPRSGLCLVREVVLPVNYSVESAHERTVRLFTLT
jgi:predicted nicotinamide N-methyase